jgi:CheY-like chemotaxis protein
MLRRLIGEDIQLITALTPDLGRVKADPGQLEQVIMNLVVNARDAMLQGGKLTIETKNVIINEAYTRQHVGIQVGTYVMLAISDTGVGMDKETLGRIFEPFFTTKEQGKGTGLGLATVHGIVKQSGGHLWVYSEPRGGTTFKIYLPQVEKDKKPISEQQTPAEKFLGTETVLVVEDEPSVRVLVRNILKTNGYTVLEAQDGDKALLLSQDYPNPIELLITDVVMPGGLSGPDLAKKLTLLRSEMKTLYVSGYTDSTIVHHGMLSSDVAFLQKPFSPDDLARKVREVLDAPQ